ncbi:uncharacterized protein DFL_001511 [Arthrobotrys flagrans]|uniref:DUF7587 domain-containing protein n=1 Tax=Arthrobotrys flagrans TaxID=97331 RepID=A0A437A7U5_ARTFL|nr:hypothetical protein DFL_001511 [Arthrobotrys flagrans]
MTRHFENAATGSYGHASSSGSRSNVLPDFRLRVRDLPQYLYRVHSSYESITEYTSSEGFISPSNREINLRGPEFISALIKHLNWGSTSPSPFISTFANESHARGWAKKFLENPGRDSNMVQIMKINPRQIRSEGNGRMPIIWVKEVVDRMREADFEILPEGRNDRQIKDEYLCLYQVPYGAIVEARTWTLDELRKPNDTRNSRSRTARPPPPFGSEQAGETIHVQMNNIRAFDAWGHGIENAMATRADNSHFVTPGETRVDHDPYRDRVAHNPSRRTVQTTTSTYGYPARGTKADNETATYQPPRLPSPKPIKRSRLKRMLNKLTHRD